MKKTVVDSLIIGFALFSMFFGAGNDLSPYLGLESAQWGGFCQLLHRRHRPGAAVDVCHHPSRQPGGITSPLGRGPLRC